MSRVDRLRDAEMDDAQRAFAPLVARSSSGELRGPFSIWIRIPEVAQRVYELSERLRTGSRFEKRLIELMILIIVRPWKAEYAWAQHVRRARDVGISPGVIDAIRRQATPAFSRGDEQLIYDMFAELNQTRSLSDDTYARGIDAFGLDLMIEMITTAGLYVMIAMILNVFEVPSATGERVL